MHLVHVCIMYVCMYVCMVLPFSTCMYVFSMHLVHTCMYYVCMYVCMYGAPI